MERAEAERVYDAGREACVEFMLELSARHEREIARLEERVARLEEQVRASSRTGSKPPWAGSAEDACAAARGGAREGEGVGER